MFVLLSPSDGLVDDHATVIILQEVQKERRAGRPVFDLVLELEGGDQPKCTVVRRVGAVVDELLASGHVPKPEMRAPLPVGAIINEVWT